MGATTISYSASAPATITLANLSNGSARQSLAIDNSTNKYLDAILHLSISLQTGTPSSDKCANIWFYASEDGVLFTDNATGIDSIITLRVPTNLRGPFVLSTPDAGAITYNAVIPSVASIFGGLLPRKWGFAVENRTGLSFNATEGNFIKTYTGITLMSAA